MQDFFTKYQISNDEVIAVGVSGGADSLALALRLNEQGHKVIALTVDHGLRPEARAWDTGLGLPWCRASVQA